MNYLDSVINYDFQNSNNGMPDHIYYDISLINNNETSEPAFVQFFEQRTTPFLYDPKQYFLSIVRFHLDTSPSSLPVFIPSIQTGQEDPNLTQYSFTLKLGNVEHQEYAVFAPQNEYETVRPPTNTQDLSTEYYFVYNFQWWIDILNTALKNCFDALSQAVEDASGTMPTTHAPFMQYDPGSSSILFNCDKLGFDEALSTPIEIYLNAPMANLLNAFCMINKGFNVTNGKNYKLVVKNYDNGNVIEYTDYDAIQLYEEYSSVGSWNPIKAIVFTSSSLPVEGTISAAPKTFGGISNLANYAPNLTTNIITDFTVNLLTGKEYLPSVDYVAGGTYRLVDMQGNQQQNNLEISIFWSDIYNNLHRFKLPSGGYGSIKIMFRKKTLGI